MIKCPHCGASHFSQGHSTRTAMYYPPIGKNGININPDMNITTTYAHCCECHYDFIIKEQGPSVWTEPGEYNPPVPPSDINITVTPKEYVPLEETTSMATINIQNNEPVRAKYKWESDIEELNKKVERLTKMIESLWEWNTHDVLDEE